MTTKKKGARARRSGADNLRDRGLVSILLHCTEDERRRIHAASGLAGQSTAEWGRVALLRAAEKTLAELHGKNS